MTAVLTEAKAAGKAGVEGEGLTRYVAEFVAGAGLSDLPRVVIDNGKKSILDGLGLALSGSVAKSGELVRRHLAELNLGTGPATVIGSDLKVAPRFAAFANGIGIHADDYDDTQLAVAKDRVYGLLTHPTAPALPAALAMGQAKGASGAEVMLAYHIGVEVECKIAEAIAPRHYQAGFHATATCGTYAAAAAAGRLMGLDRETLERALSVAGSQSAGLRENFGTMTKPFHAGHAARSGVLSAVLAREGWTASEHALEGPQGFFRVLGAGKLALEPLGTLAAPWKILTTGVAVKPYPSCACTHSIIDGALELRRVEGIRADEVEEVTVGVAAGVPRILIHSRPRTGLEAKFSAEFSAAAALMDGRVGMATFQDDRAQDPDLRRLMERIRVVVDPEIPTDLEHHMWTRMTVRLKGGRSASISPRPVPGHPGNPLTLEALRAKFEECAALVLPADRVDSVARIVESLDTCPDLRSLTAILAPGR
jgi:2-methylcitrate dehydratase PrpD